LIELKPKMIKLTVCDNGGQVNSNSYTMRNQKPEWTNYLVAGVVQDYKSVLMI
jgi:hypothetical protein